MIFQKGFKFQNVSSMHMNTLRIMEGKCLKSNYLVKIIFWSIQMDSYKDFNFGVNMPDFIFVIKLLFKCVF